MSKLYTSSHPAIIVEYGYDPIATIYHDSAGQTVYVTDGNMEPLSSLQEIPLTEGMTSRGVLIFKTLLNESELA